ncbi:unnamed protein product [Effrenium voratum]|nr:unnamed protein product [Effrenium voratum]
MGQCQHVEKVQPFDFEEKQETGRAEARSFPPVQAGSTPGQCAFFLEQVRNVPALLPGSLCAANGRNPSVAAWVESSGKLLGKVAEWPGKSCLHPCWFSARALDFSLAEASTATLRLEIRDAGTVLGSLQVPLKDLALHQRIERSAELQPGASGDALRAGAAPMLVSFQILDCSVVLKRRVVYLVRHGESQWNKAQHKMDLHGMMRTTDHPLSAKGREQAEKLCRLLQEELDKEVASQSVAGLLRPGLVLASPLGRALQTAVLTYGPLLGKAGPAGNQLILAPNCKEKQNLGGLDTACTKVGQEILTGCLEELKGLYSGQGKDAITSAFRQFQFDLQEVEDKSWQTSASTAETANQLQGRLEEFMYQLLFSCHDSIVVFGHSLFFQQLMRRFFAADYRPNALAQRLSFGKLPNCGVVRLELDPSRMLDGPLLKAELVLGTEMAGSEGNCALNCCAAAGPDTMDELRPDDTSPLPLQHLPSAGLPPIDAAPTPNNAEETQGDEPNVQEPAKQEPAPPTKGPAKMPAKPVKKCCPF